MDSREALVALNLIEGVGPVRVRQLLEYFGEPSAILAANKTRLLGVRGIGEDTAEAIASWEKSVDLAGELKRQERARAGISLEGGGFGWRDDGLHRDLLAAVF